MSCFQQLVLRLLTVACIAGWADQLPAQDPAPPPATTPAAAPAAAPPAGAAAAPAAGASSLAPLEFPPMPDGIFYRGNRNSLGPEMSPAIGGYISLFKFAFVLLLFFAWVHYGNWVAEDAESLKVRPIMWNGVQMGAGLLAMLLFLTVPNYAGAFVGGLLAWGGPLALYIKERNDHVPDSGKVMTPAHIRKWTIRQLARLGINIGGGKAVESIVGPPIQFIGKTRTGAKDEKASRAVENSKGYMAARELVYDAILRRATDIHIEPNEDETSVRIRIDGVMYPTEPFDRPIGDAIINIFKVLSRDGHHRAPPAAGRQLRRHLREARDRLPRRHPGNAARREAEHAYSRPVELGQHARRPRDAQAARGEDPRGHQPAARDVPELRPDRRRQVDDAVRLPQSASTDTRTTSSRSRTRSNTRWTASRRSRSTRRSGRRSPRRCEAILRQDPDVVMIGEIRDDETAKIACQAANTGHMVFSTVHANDTITALYRLLDLGVEPFMLARSLSAILGQRLARRLCPHCREAYQPNPDLLKKAGLPADKIESSTVRRRTPRKRARTAAASGTGVAIGVFELLIINDRMRDMIRDKAAMSAIKAEARKNGMLYMKEEGLRLVVRGVTSVDELLRVVK